MPKNSIFYLLMVIFLAITTACTPQGLEAPVRPSASVETPIQDQSITLRLAVADEPGRSSEPYVFELIDQVKTLSDGSIIIEPTWDAGMLTVLGFEQGVVKMVKEGQFDLGLAASRAFDSQSITTFQALQAPFLITDDALAEAIASSEIATQMLDRLSTAGMTGLAIWPEDLRHPFSIISGKPVLSPVDFEGSTVRVIPSEVTHRLIDLLGGNSTYDGDYQLAESGLWQKLTLTGAPTATGNVSFFPKFQVLFANGDSFKKLTDSQRAIILEAAAATQEKAVTGHPSELDAAAAWCADGGTIVMASEEQVTAFEAAAQPIFDMIEQDSFSKDMIVAIRELKAITEPASGAEACEPQVKEDPAPTAETEVWSTGLPPNGVWQVEMTPDDFVQKGVMQSASNEWAGVYTTTMMDGKSVTVWEGEQGQTGKCQANYELVEDVVRFTYYTDANECVDEIDDLRWRLDEDGLHFQVVDIRNAPFTEIKAYLESKPWQKIADD